MDLAGTTLGGPASTLQTRSANKTMEQTLGWVRPSVREVVGSGYSSLTFALEYSSNHAPRVPKTASTTTDSTTVVSAVDSISITPSGRSFDHRRIQVTYETPTPSARANHNLVCVFRFGISKRELQEPEKMASIHRKRSLLDRLAGWNEILRPLHEQRKAPRA